MELKKYLKNWLKGETAEVGLYLAMARKAEKEGYPEISGVLRRIASEEAEHAAISAELLGKVGTTEENLRKMLDGEKNAAKTRLDEAAHHGEPEKMFLLITAKDEERHAEALNGLLKRFFK